PAFTPFEEIDENTNPDSAYLVACYYVAEEGDTPVVDDNEIRVVGSADWLGSWDPANSVGLMNKVSMGVYQITFEDVAIGNYFFKFTNHGTWDENWGVEGANGSDIPLDVAELSNVTITFYIADGSYEIEIVPVPVIMLGDYYVAGSAGLCGSEWVPNDESNRMVDNGDGSYSITYTDIAAGSYEFKFTKGTWDENWGVGGANGGNIPVELTALSDVTITFYEADGSYDVTITPKDDPIDPPIDPPVDDPILSDYYVAGNSGLCGSEWDAADANNRMTDNGDGTYTITYNNVAAGTYEFKITKGNWDENWGVGGANGGNVSVTMDSAGSVTITFNAATGEITVNNKQAAPPISTGDVSLDGIFFVMILAAMGVVATVVCKKKFF
ncbi:MAG: hypothetical protein IJB11_03925, partial [Oscillospiraceae bacterium]|nr:hypothetical protein [Oscillospiraceae bacterium]